MASEMYSLISNQAKAADHREFTSSFNVQSGALEEVRLFLCPHVITRKFKHMCTSMYTDHAPLRMCLLFRVHLATAILLGLEPHCSGCIALCEKCAHRLHVA